jgi:hypothetical protein
MWCVRSAGYACGAGGTVQPACAHQREDQTQQKDEAVALGPHYHAQKRNVRPALRSITHLLRALSFIVVCAVWCDDVVMCSDKEKETIWREIKIVEFDVKEFEEEFCMKESGGRGAKGPDAGAAEAEAAAPVRKGPARVLDGKRSNALGIMISKLPRPPLVAVRSALISMDSEVLKEDKITAILASVPTNDEIDAIKAMAEVEGEKNLDVPEQYVMPPAAVCCCVPLCAANECTVLYYAVTCDEMWWCGGVGVGVGVCVVQVFADAFEDPASAAAPCVLDVLHQIRRVCDRNRQTPRSLARRMQSTTHRTATSTSPPVCLCCGAHVM